MEKLGVIPPKRPRAAEAETTQDSSRGDAEVRPVRDRQAGEAVLLETEARLKRSQAATEKCPDRAATLRREAGEMVAEADKLRGMAASFGTLSVGRGGEVSNLPVSTMPLNLQLVAEAVQKAPDTLDAEASFDRLNLAWDAGVLTTAVATAESIGAGSATEQMMAHQQAAAHSMFMRLMAGSAKALSRHESERPMDNMRLMTEATRFSGAAARLMDSLTRSASALDRMRNGGRQHVTVQHVHVSDGGQAVVAGSMGALGNPSQPQGGEGEA